MWPFVCEAGCECPCREAGGWEESDELHQPPLKVSTLCFFLAGFPTGTDLTEIGVPLQDLWVGHCSQTRTHSVQDMTPGPK